MQTLSYPINLNNAELAQMYFIYGLANGNVTETRSIYQERYSKRKIQSKGTFKRLPAELCEMCSLNKYAEHSVR